MQKDWYFHNGLKYGHIEVHDNYYFSLSILVMSLRLLRVMTLQLSVANRWLTSDYRRTTASAFVNHHGVQPSGCMDIEPEPSRCVPG